MCFLGFSNENTSLKKIVVFCCPALYYEDDFGGCTWTLLPPKVVCIRHEAQADEEIVAWVKQHTNLIAHLPLSTFPDFIFLLLLYIHPAY